MTTTRDQVVEVIVQWALALERPGGRARINRKLLFGDQAIAEAVQGKLKLVFRRSCSKSATRPHGDLRRGRLREV